MKVLKALHYLRPCRVCGGQAYLHVEDSGDSCRLFYYVVCHTCGRTTGAHTNAMDAMETWDAEYGLYES